jgi:hypothetical protein
MLRALLTNIQVLAKSSSPKKTVSKEPYFDKKWGQKAAFEKSFDRTAYASDVQDHTAQINDQILVMFKTIKTMDQGRNRFINRITVDSMDFIQEQKLRMMKAKQEEQLCQNSMAVMTEQIFEIIKSYAYELNNALGYGPFHMAATNPQTVTEVLKFDRMRQAEETITYYRARLSTPSFSLVMRGDKKGIQFFVMPVARAIGLSRQECHFIPVMRLSTRLEDEHVTWETEEGIQLTAGMVEGICMDVFQRLIDETKLEISLEEDEENNSEVAATAS